jgi:hypothetical protein
MAGSLKLQAGATTTCVSSGGSVSSGAAAIANGASNLVNSTNLDQSATARLVAPAASAPAQGAVVALYLVPKSDGTNVAGVDTSTPYFNPNYFAGNFVWPAASSAAAQTMDIDGIPLSAIDYVPYIVNSLGVAISTTWTLVFYGSKGQYT